MLCAAKRVKPKNANAIHSALASKRNVFLKLFHIVPTQNQQHLRINSRAQQIVDGTTALFMTARDTGEIIMDFWSSAHNINEHRTNSLPFKVSAQGGSN